MTAIITERLTRCFGERTAVDQLDIEIHNGEIFGFLGPNGAGKTTTIRMLAALVAPTSGRAMIAGHWLGQDDTAIRRSIGILTETPGLYEQLTAEQNIHFFGKLYGLSAAHVREQAERYLRTVDLWERRHELVGTFSKGMRQKLAIARALLHEPQILFLDEPTSGLDPAAARAVRAHVQALCAAGRTIFLTSHNLTEVEELCDRVALFKGQLLRVDTPARLRADLFGRRKVVEFVGPAAPWKEVVDKLPFVVEVQQQGQILSVVLSDPAVHSSSLIQALVGAGASVQNIHEQVASLEDVYLQFVNTHSEATLTA